MEAATITPSIPSTPAATCREVVGVFRDLPSAQEAVEQLQSSGFNRADISTLARMNVVESTLGHALTDIREMEDDPKAERSVFISRRSLGDAEGLLIAAGIYLGAVVGAGFSAAAGASDQGIILAVVILGGVGALLGYAIAHWLGTRYDHWFGEQLRRGGIVVWVTVHSAEQDQRALGIMRSTGARDVHVHDLPALVVNGARTVREAPHHPGWYHPPTTTPSAATASPAPGAALPDTAPAYARPAARGPAARAVDATASNEAAGATQGAFPEHGFQSPFQWPVSDRALARARPVVRKIGWADIKDALAKGREDFVETPTQLLFLGIIYPIVGFIAARAASGGDLLALFYPLVAGLSLMGPIAALGIYELSRRREQGLEVSWVNALDVRHSRSWFSILALGAVLLAIFVAWLASAMAIYDATLSRPPESIGDFARQLFTTREGWTLILLGNGIGFLFAVVVLMLTVVSFPLLLDRDVGPIEAMRTSVRAVLKNPAPMAVWGLIVASLLLIACLPFFVGLAVVMPILGHATWHLYRKVVAP